MSVHFLSMSVDWATPKAIYDALDAEFHFDCDPCELGGGMWRGGEHWPEKDGLICGWGGHSFVNPPYGRDIGKWTAKAVEEWQTGKTVVMLIPSRTDTIWWHRDIMQATEIRFIKGRLKFGDAVNSAPFPSAVVVFRSASVPVLETPPPPEIDWRDMYDRAAKIANTYETISVMKHGDLVKSLPHLTALLESFCAPVEPVPAPTDPLSTSSNTESGKWGVLVDEPVPAPQCNERERVHRLLSAHTTVDYDIEGLLDLIVSEPVPAPRLEWREIDEGRWQAEHERNTFRIADVTALRLFPAFAIMVNEGNSMVDCPSLPAAKATVERILAVLSPPVGTQE